MERLPQSDDDDDSDSDSNSEQQLIVALEWRDVLFLFHALQVSRPVLQPHHTGTTAFNTSKTTTVTTRRRRQQQRMATDVSVLDEIEQLTYATLQRDVMEALRVDATDVAIDAALPSVVAVVARVSQLLAFSGPQVHARQWKALLLLDFALLWLVEIGDGDDDENAIEAAGSITNGEKQQVLQRDAFARQLLVAVFETVRLCVAVGCWLLDAAVDCVSRSFAPSVVTLCRLV